MTEVEAIQALTMVCEHTRYWSALAAFACCWIAGTLSLKYFLYVKNHRDLW